ncbi:Uma2 family endonuclease [Amycolatopsis pigmentata]|uniref:Uma2 family endonuclease n=1 Tax=Amycolatopsis pigmentata TaxID=450801 RepID=A0ABW5G408_9PSEU
MSTAFADSAPTWDYLLHTWRDLKVPEGWRPELTVEEIHMTPPPGGAHNLVAGRLHRALLPVVPEGCEIFQTQGVGFHQVGAIYVPNLCVARVDRILPGSDPVPAEHVSLAVEITSRRNAERSRKKEAPGLCARLHSAVPAGRRLRRGRCGGVAVQ